MSVMLLFAPMSFCADCEFMAMRGKTLEFCFIWCRASCSCCLMARTMPCLRLREDGRCPDWYFLLSLCRRRSCLGSLVFFVSRCTCCSVSSMMEYNLAGVRFGVELQSDCRSSMSSGSLLGKSVRITGLLGDFSNGVGVCHLWFRVGKPSFVVVISGRSCTL